MSLRLGHVLTLVALIGTSAAAEGLQPPRLGGETEQLLELGPGDGLPGTEPRTLLTSSSFLFGHPLAGSSSVRRCVFDDRACARPGWYHTAIDEEAVTGATIRATNFGERTGLTNDCSGDHGLGNAARVRYLLDDGTNIWGQDNHMLRHATWHARPDGLVQVAKGMKVGEVGKSGHCGTASWGPHDHHEMKLGNVLLNPCGGGPYFGYTPTSAVNYCFRNPDDYIGRRRVLMPEFSLTDGGWGDHDVLYGVAGQRIYSRLQVVNAGETLDQLLVGGRVGFGAAIADFPSISNVTGTRTHVANKTFAAGDYTFFAAVRKGTEWRTGYRMVFTVLPTANDVIRDNDMASASFQGSGLGLARYDGYGYGAFAAVGNSTAWGRWFPKSAGRKAASVYVGGNGVGRVRYKIYRTGSSLPLLSDPVDLAANRYRWVDLTIGVTRAWDFDATGFVELASGSGTSSEIYLFDAVKFTAQFVPTSAAIELEMDPGSLRAPELADFQTRWGVARCGYLRQETQGEVAFTVAVPSSPAASFVDVPFRACLGVSAAPYAVLVNGTEVVRFSTGMDEDRTWVQGSTTLAFDFQEQRPGGTDNNGVMRLHVPWSAVRPGQANTIAFRPLADGGPWDWLIVAGAPHGTASAEAPIGSVVAVGGGDCAVEHASTFGPYAGCVSRAAGSSDVVDVTVRLPSVLEAAKPSVQLRGALGLDEGRFSLLLNDRFLGYFDSGAADSTTWDFGGASLWWRVERDCHCGTDYNGWMTLTAPRSYWLTGDNVISIEPAGAASGPWAWSLVHECDHAHELLDPNEGFDQFLSGATTCASLPSAWGTVQTCSAGATSTPQRVAFRSAVTRAQTPNEVVLSWLGANGIHRAAHQLTVNGTPVLRFDSGQASDRTWLSADGRSRLAFRFVATLPGATDHNGVYTLVVPTSIVGAGSRATIEMNPVTDGGAYDWLAVFGFAETERERNTLP